VTESVVEAAEAAEAATGKSPMMEPTHAAHVMDSAHMAEASHPSLSRNGDAGSGHSEHGGCQKAFQFGSEDHDAFSSYEMNTRRPCAINARGGRRIPTHR
jgi:hypothetical protein